ncbi:unnamed protein product [Closterium sp. Naga37s-1]|nr:unnamed protein product [Closterium sp. Naga37s-1]
MPFRPLGARVRCHVTAQARASTNQQGSDRPSLLPSSLQPRFGGRTCRLGVAPAAIGPQPRSSLGLGETGALGAGNGGGGSSAGGAASASSATALSAARSQTPDRPQPSLARHVARSLPVAVLSELVAAAATAGGTAATAAANSGLPAHAGHLAIPATAVTPVAVTALAAIYGAYLSDNLLGRQKQPPKTEPLIIESVDVTDYPIFRHPEVLRAVEFARDAHWDQYRKTGEPYVNHCVHTARILAALVPPQGKKAVDAVVAAVLHDIVDDTPYDIADVEMLFGADVAQLVDGVSRLSHINQLLRRHRRATAEQRAQENTGLSSADVDSLRMMLLGMVNDPRVVLIKLADRLHNMRTIYALKDSKARAVAQETLSIWCSLASLFCLLPILSYSLRLLPPPLSPSQLRTEGQQGTGSGTGDAVCLVLPRLSPRCVGRESRARRLMLRGAGAELEDLCFAVLEGDLALGSLVSPHALKRAGHHVELPGGLAVAEKRLRPFPCLLSPFPPKSPPQPRIFRQLRGELATMWSSPEDWRSLRGKGNLYSSQPFPLLPLPHSTPLQPRIFRQLRGELATMWSSPEDWRSLREGRCVFLTPLPTLPPTALNPTPATDEPEKGLIHFITHAGSAEKGGTKKGTTTSGGTQKGKGSSGTMQGKGSTQGNSLTKGAKSSGVLIANEFLSMVAAAEGAVLDAVPGGKLLQGARDEEGEEGESEPSVRDLIEAVVPFDLLADRNRRSRAVAWPAAAGRAATGAGAAAPGSGTSATDGTTSGSSGAGSGGGASVAANGTTSGTVSGGGVRRRRTRVMRDAEVALTALHGCEEALQRELLITTPYVPGMEVVLSGRLKSMYSCHAKMRRKRVPLDKIYDARALRVVVGDANGTQHEAAVEACYNLLCVVHSLWTPIGGEFDDYILNPKPSGYQSLHTAVRGPDGAPLEVQIRTQSMHEYAEFGHAAHWLYKESDTPDSAPSTEPESPSNENAPPVQSGSNQQPQQQGGSTSSSSSSSSSSLLSSFTSSVSSKVSSFLSSPSPSDPSASAGAASDAAAASGAADSGRERRRATGKFQPFSATDFENQPFEGIGSSGMTVSGSKGGTMSNRSREGSSATDFEKQPFEGFASSGMTGSGSKGGTMSNRGRESSKGETQSNRSNSGSGEIVGRSFKGGTQSNTSNSGSTEISQGTSRGGTQSNRSLQGRMAASSRATSSSSERTDAATVRVGSGGLEGEIEKQQQLQQLQQQQQQQEEQEEQEDKLRQDSLVDAVALSEVLVISWPGGEIVRLPAGSLAGDFARLRAKAATGDAAAAAAVISSDGLRLSLSPTTATPSASGSRAVSGARGYGDVSSAVLCPAEESIFVNGKRVDPSTRLRDGDLVEGWGSGGGTLCGGAVGDDEVVDAAAALLYPAEESIFVNGKRVDPSTRLRDGDLVERWGSGGGALCGGAVVDDEVGDAAAGAATASDRDAAAAVLYPAEESIFVNGKRVDPSTRLRDGDLVEVRCVEEL